MIKIKNQKIVEITWFDAQSSMETFTLDELVNVLEPIKTKSIGYLLHECDDYIILGFMLFGDELIKHHQVIPRGMIKKIKTLKYTS